MTMTYSLELSGAARRAWAYRRNATLKGPTLKAAIDAALKGHHD